MDVAGELFRRFIKWHNAQIRQDFQLSVTEAIVASLPSDKAAGENNDW
jgi:hypothetical protein